MAPPAPSASHGEAGGHSTINASLRAADIAQRGWFVGRCSWRS